MHICCHNQVAVLSDLAYLLTSGCYVSCPLGGNSKSKQAAPRVWTDHWEQDYSYTLYCYITAAQITVRAALCVLISTLNTCVTECCMKWLRLMAHERIWSTLNCIINKTQWFDWCPAVAAGVWTERGRLGTKRPERWGTWPRIQRSPSSLVPMNRTQMVREGGNAVLLMADCQGWRVF